jgi:hypothetical protein
MLSIEQCRALLPADCGLSDRDIEDLREQTYSLAGLLVHHFLKQAHNSGAKLSHAGSFRAALQLVPKDQQAEIEERAAIVEFDGGLTRDEAERTAFVMTFQNLSS